MRLEAFLFVSFPVVVSTIVFVVWKAWQICYSVLKQLCHNRNAFVLIERMIRAPRDTCWSYIVNAFRVYITKLRKNHLA